MADRPQDGDERERKRPVPVPPILKPVARPVVPPVVPPVAKPVAPRIVAPAVPPAVPPSIPPSVPQRRQTPAVPPVVRPVAAPPPVVAPVAPPVLAPVAPPVAQPVAPPPPVVQPAAGGRRRGRSAEEEAPKGRGRDRDSGQGRGAPAAGMGIGAKVALVVLFTTMAVIAVAVLPSLKRGDEGNDASAAFKAAGYQAARLVATAIGDTGSAPGAKPSWSKPFDEFSSGVDEQLKALRAETGPRDTLSRSLSVLKALASDPTGKAAAKAVDDMLQAVNDRIKAAKEDDEKTPLLAQREKLIALKKAFSDADAGGSSATAPGASKVDRLKGGPDGLSILAIWVTSPKRDQFLAVTPAAEPFPSPPASDASLQAADWEATVHGVAATVFSVPTANNASRVHVAIPSPAPTAAPAAGNPIGLAMIFVGAAIVAVLGWTVASRHAKPLKDLARELERLGASGEPGRRIPARGSEAGAIARSVERMVANLKFRDQHEMADLQEVIEKEQGTAATIHHGLMPKDPPRIAGWEVETLFKPGYEIGGDHFDYFRIDDTHLGVILMDTSVRGIPAALVMAMAHAYVRGTAPGVLSPADTLMKVNRLLAADLPSGQYVTALYVVIDTASGTAKVASAGHLPMVVYRHQAGQTAVVNPEGVALGLDVGPVFDRALTEVEVSLGVGDRLVLHTDGAVKVTNDVGEEFGERRLYDAIKEKAPMNSQAFVNFVGSGIDAFHPATPQDDDITISTVKRLK